MPIDLSRAAGKFATNASNAAGDYVAGATANAQLWERNAKSPSAEKNYATGVQIAVQNQLRAKGLAGVTASDYAAGVQNNANVYAQKVGQSSDKWANKFSPFASIIDRMTVNLPPRNPAAAPSQNYASRGGPIADALKQARLQGVMGARFAAPSAFGQR